MLDNTGGSTSDPAGDAAIPASPATNIVHLAERCPGSPHEFDFVILRKTASISMGIAVSSIIREGAGDQARIEAGLATEFLRWGIESWSFTEPTGPVSLGEPVERAQIERWLPYENGGLEVVEAASALYGDAVLAPFLRRSRNLSLAMRIATSTSATNGSGSTHRKRSKRSSRITTAGKSSEVPAG